MTKAIRVTSAKGFLRLDANFINIFTLYMQTDYHSKFNEGQYYHIYNRTNGKDSLFKVHGNYLFFLKKMKVYIVPYCDIYAYCLMGNHFHIILNVKVLDDNLRMMIKEEYTIASQKLLAGECDINTFLEDQFKRFFNSYTAAINKYNRRHGSLFQKRFRRVLIRTENALRDKICYVHHNPIHHNYCDDYETWEFSSYMAYLSQKTTSISRDAGLFLFGNNANIDSFKAIHELYRIEYLGANDDIEND